MVFKRKFVIFYIVIDVVFLFLFIGGFVASFLSAQKFGFSKILDINFYYPVVVLLEVGIFPFAHGGYRRLLRPSAEFKKDQLIIVRGYRIHKIPYGKIQKADINKTVYLYFLDQKNNLDGTYVDIRFEDFSNFEQALKNEIQKIEISK